MKTVIRLALAGMKKNLTRTILTGIAIFLTTLLLTAIGLGGSGMLEENKKLSADEYGEHYGSFLGMTTEQKKKAEIHAMLYNIGSVVNIGSVEDNKYNMSLQFYDDKAVELSHLSLQSGDMPKNTDEIAAPKGFFKVLGNSNPKIGDKVKVPFRINGAGEIITEDFVICGFAKSNEINELSKSYLAYVSNQFMEKYLPDEQMRREMMLFQVRNEDNKNEAQMKEFIMSIAEDLGLEEKQVNVNNMYLLYSLDPGTEILISCILIMIVIVLFSIIVIYNIFHVAVTQRIKEFGRLKAIGASQRQLKALVRMEGVILSVITIPVGILFGMIVVKCFFKMFMDINLPLGNMAVFVIVVLISFLAVMISIQKPLRTAAKISPVEAARYESGKKSKANRKGKRQLSVLTLTLSNLAINKKRTITTILTMGLSCVLFVVISNIVSNMDSEKQARQDIEFGRFRIEIDGSLNDQTYPENNMNEIQKKQPFNSEFLGDIKNIQGVTDIRTRKIMAVKNVTSSSNESFSKIAVVDKDEFDWLVEDRKRGEVDYENTVRKDGCIYMYDYFLQYDGYKIGDTVKFDILDGDRKVPFSAEILGSCGHSNDADITITEDTFNKLDIQGDMTSVVFVDCDKKNEGQVLNSIENLIEGMDNISIKSYSDILKINNLQILFTKSACYAFLVILGVIGFMNMANTMITSIITRKREFGVIQATGMSNRQFNYMLQTEGMIFSAGTLFVALTVGNLLGYAAFCWCKKKGWFGLFQYELPYLEILILIVGIIFLQVILSWLLSRNVKKESIVDRIQHDG